MYNGDSWNSSLRQFKYYPVRVANRRSVQRPSNGKIMSAAVVPEAGVLITIAVPLTVKLSIRLVPADRIVPTPSACKSRVTWIRKYTDDALFSASSELMLCE